MPELPEVETTRLGIEPHVRGQKIEALIVRDRRLRWPIPEGLEARLAGATVERIERRAKYLLFSITRAGRPLGTLLGHLGMSGSLRIVTPRDAPRPHDHVDLRLAGGKALRLHDPRRFGSLLWIDGDPARHPLLRDLGPEPLSSQFDGAWLATLARGRSAPVKSFLMDGHVVVGVGNIYANESLWRAAIHPRRPARRIGAERYDALVAAVKTILAAAIERGGTTLRDFVRADGAPGYFKLELAVYDHAGEPCPRCRSPIRVERVGQRSTFFCARCQK